MAADLDSIGEIDWDGLLLDHDFSDFADILENSTSSEPEPLTQAPQPLPDDGNLAVSSWIGGIEKILMEDDHLDDKLHPLPLSDDFFADILLDSPPSGSGEVSDDAAATDADAAASDAAALHKQNNAHNDGDDADDDPLAKKRRRY